MTLTRRGRHEVAQIEQALAALQVSNLPGSALTASVTGLATQLGGVLRTELVAAHRGDDGGDREADARQTRAGDRTAEDRPTSAGDRTAEAQPTSAPDGSAAAQPTNSGDGAAAQPTGAPDGTAEAQPTTAGDATAGLRTTGGGV
jgi:hypothetical protein